jgi:hypothetical protein
LTGEFVLILHELASQRRSVKRRGNGGRRMDFEKMGDELGTEVEGVRNRCAA